MPELNKAQWARYWAQWDYTKPVADALKDAYGTEFTLWNTGGGCICLGATLEGGLEVLVGSGIDGPLWTGEERDEYKAEHGRFDGYGVGVYNAEEGQSLAYVTDALATDTDVVELMRRALDRVPQARDGRYPAWIRGADGTVKEDWYQA